jgi:hypothetical protein
MRPRRNPATRRAGQKRGSFQASGVLEVDAIHAQIAIPRKKGAIALLCQAAGRRVLVTPFLPTFGSLSMIGMVAWIEVNG